MSRRMLAWLASIRLRTLFRAVFLLLALATVTLALTVLREEKQQSFDNYRERFGKTGDQIAARLRHPTGQLALLNPLSGAKPLTPLRPLLLPYSALDFDEHNKVRNAIEMSGCLVQYPRDAALCVAVGSNPWAGAFIYAAGRLKMRELVPHERGERDFSKSHRVHVHIALRGEDYNWIAPFELEADTQPKAGKALRGRLTGFVERAGGDYVNARPQNEFRGWLWQSACPRGEIATPDCEREVFYSIRLPVDLLRADLAGTSQPVWPPRDLDSIQVHVQMLAPGNAGTIFDSNDKNAHAPFLLAELQTLLLPGESLLIRKLGKAGNTDVLRMTGIDAAGEEPWPLINWLIRRLPVEADGFRLESHTEISTQTGRYELVLNGDVRSANRILAGAVTRVSWFVGAMLLAIAMAWLVIELGLIRRITILTKRTRAVQQSASSSLDQLDVADLRGGDELGILATCLHDLLRRVREDIEREKIRTEQEKDLWHAVGHEIMSPLQSLLVLHDEPDNPSQRYLQRMQQAIRVLYGSASPSEAFESSCLQVRALDLNAFLAEVARNAPCAGINNVVYVATDKPVPVRADEYPLEDVVTHVLSNAERYRSPGSPITIRLEPAETSVQIVIHNQGQPISEDMLDKIFEYGVSSESDSGAQGNRGQGLFVAKTYMAKMGGTICARNVANGVEFALGLLLAPEREVQG